ncbi:MAG: anhydro-N-acetylmuramic acid kinase [Dongiaceae bacterium]
MSKLYNVLGLMSGTSLDGLDIAYLETDGEGRVEPGPGLTFPYSADFQTRLRSILGGKGKVEEVENELTRLHLKAIQEFMAQFQLPPIDLIGIHGHTILHDPKNRKTWQITKGQILADELKIPVIADMRQADVQAGGQGAPLVPLYHQARAKNLPKPLAIVNIGGVANITYITEKDLWAFDTGTGVALLNDWIHRHTGKGFDESGAIAAGGKIDQEKIKSWLQDSYFKLPPPKSLDRDHFKAKLRVDDLSLEDGAATLAAFTAQTIALSKIHLPQAPKAWFIAGGGRLHSFIMKMLAEYMQMEVKPVEALGWSGDFLEAEAFGYLAVRSVKALPLSLPTTTGVKQPITGGVLFKPASL